MVRLPAAVAAPEQLASDGEDLSGDHGRLGQLQATSRRGSVHPGGEAAEAVAGSDAHRVDEVAAASRMRRWQPADT